MRRHPYSSKAFSMVEVALALGIASFCLVVLFGLLPAGLTSKKEAIQYTIAAGIASEVVSDLRATPLSTGTTPTAKTSSRFQFVIPAVAGSATMTTNPQTIYLAEDGTTTGNINTAPDPAKKPMFRVTVGFAPPASGKLSTQVRILINWPALAYADPATWPTSATDSFEVLTALDRN